MARNIKQLMEILAILYCIAAVYGERMKFGIHATVLIIAELFLLTGINEYGFPTYLLSLSYLGFFVYCLLCYQKDVKETLVRMLLAMAVTSVLQLIVYLPVFQLVILKNGLKESYEIAINFICLVLVIFLVPKLKLKKLADYISKNNIILLLITGCILVYLGIRIYTIKITQLISGEEYIEVLCFVLVLFLLINEWQKTKMEAERRNAELRISKLYYGVYDELITLIRDRQHEMKNHLAAILGMIYTCNDFEELVQKQKEYCNYVMSQNEDTKIALFVENPLIAGFVYSKIKEAATKGILVEHQMIFPKKTLPFSEYEIVEMIGILFDNAMEALVELKPESPKIRMNIFLEEQLEIIIANVSDYFDYSLIQRFFERHYSSKGVGRGIGLNKLKRMVKDKGGTLFIANEMMEGVNYLKFSIVLPIEEKDRNS